MALSNELLALINKTKAKHTRGNQTNIVKLKEGKTRVRILPSWRGVDDPQFFHEFGTHWVKESAGGKPLAVVGCYEATYSQPCGVCAAIASASVKARDPDLVEVLKEAKVRREVLVNALVRNGDTPNEPVVLSFTNNTFLDVLSLMEEWGAIQGLEDGVDLVIERTGKTKNDTRYKVSPAPKSEKVPLSILDKLHNLDEFVKAEFGAKEQRALAAIAQISGQTPVLTAASQGLLTSGRYIEHDAPVRSDTQPKVVAAEDLNDILSELDESSIPF